MSSLVARDGALWLDDICCVPSIHGRAMFAREVRRLFLSRRFDVVAVELPASLEPAVVESVEALPHITAVVAAEPSGAWCYVPADPCDSIIEAIRLAIRERTPLEFIDAETADFKGHELILPDDYALSGLSLPEYYAAVLEALPSTGDQGDERERHMAARLREFTHRGQSVLFVCGLAHLRGIVEHYRRKSPAPEPVLPPFDINIYSIHPDSLYFVLGEIPHTTYRYESVRSSMTLEEFEKIDAIKEVCLATRDEYEQEHPDEMDRIPPSQLKTLLHYARNLTLLYGRLTPSLYSLAVAAKGTVGNDFALKLLEIAKYYPFLDPLSPYPTLETDGQHGKVRDEQEALKTRLPSLAKEWKRLSLEKKAEEKDKERWRTMWDPYRSCSWPPEDEIIEGFSAHVRRRALQVVGQRQVRTEEFLTSLRDGIDVRETLRNVHLGKIFVREEPVVRGRVGAVLFIFEESHDDDRFPWRTTWHAEHANESTLAFYATDFRDNLVGPGIARAEYGGALFLFPPLPIPDIWEDPRFNHARNVMERLTLAGVFYARETYVAYVAAKPPSVWMKEQARKRGRHLVFLPLSTFNPRTLVKLRRFHVLNGREVRSWATRFIR